MSTTTKRVLFYILCLGHKMRLPTEKVADKFIWMEILFVLNNWTTINAVPCPDHVIVVFVWAIMQENGVFYM